MRKEIIRKDGKVYYNGKCYTEGEWEGIMAELDEIGKILTMWDPTSTYDPETKIWHYKNVPEDK